MEWASKSERVVVSFYALGLFLVAIILLAIPVRAFAADIEMPVPTAVIYPGQNILDRGVSDARFKVPADKLNAYVIERGMLTDMIAKRTLMPNKPIMLSDLKSPDLVRAGVPAPIVYREPGLVITAVGLPLASAGAGDAIRVRNADSGVTISGVVAKDGSIEVLAP
ncbi:MULTISPECIES: flagellar basal body P-ring formation chaperone FlgA [unclassified Aureimonas]|uniref:flagellar basal body P-ring formation chaperone FlgA n=1 Tax=unclassified Aureimonas TaxID=2615206 RepID=UPI0006FE3825|nr:MULTISPECIES: flagellar basal body P-ring formation chaperone FlgA [unclassified Aureimonas]KQT66279.1 flagellar biosynthesis protein FlgA [Aureimonas sp. Leaf427]KQT72467.1 flagellar biosynthesis protein FlgA [Aureimonas sp. Leaf460]